MSRYVEQAVDALYAQINGSIASKCTAVETASSLSAGDLPAPTVIKYEAENDNRSPLIQIFEDGFEGDQRNGVYYVPCRVVFTLKSDADLSAAEVKVRRYIDAIMRSVLADPTLGGLAPQCVFTGASAHMTVGDESTTRHGYELAWTVTVESDIGG